MRYLINFIVGGVIGWNLADRPYTIAEKLLILLALNGFYTLVEGLAEMLLHRLFA